MEYKLKRVFRMFLAWQDEREAEWLSDMARQGWLMIKFNLFWYTFISAEPNNYVYKLDYQKARGEELHDYLSLFKDAGWQHVDKFGNWHYFRIKAGEGTEPDIYSDNNSKIGKYKGILRLLIAAAIVQIPSLINLFANPIYYKMDDGSLNFISFAKVLVLGVLFLLVYGIIKINLKIKSLKR